MLSSDIFKMSDDLNSSSNLNYITNAIRYNQKMYNFV